MPGCVFDGLKEPQPVPLVGQSRPLLTTVGDTYPLPAPLGEADRPRPTRDGNGPPSSWMQASAVRKSTEPCEYTLPLQPGIEPLL